MLCLRRWWLLSSCLGAVSASLFNVTIDDTLGDSLTGVKPQYPVGGMVAFPGNTPCTGCPFIDTNQMQNKTFHLGTSNTSKETQIILTWTGTDIFVYFALVSGTAFATDLTFSMDSQDAGTFSFRDTVPNVPLSEGTVSFNRLVFSKTGVKNGSHALWIGSNNPNGELVVSIFDYAQYTTGVDDTPTTPSTPSNTGPDSNSDGTPGNQSANTSHTDKSHAGLIAGVVVGSVVGAILLVSVLTIAYFRGRNNRAQKRVTYEPSFVNAVPSTSYPSGSGPRNFPRYPTGFAYEPYQEDPRDSTTSPPMSPGMSPPVTPRSPNPLIPATPLSPVSPVLAGHSLPESKQSFLRFSTPPTTPATPGGFATPRTPRAV